MSQLAGIEERAVETLSGKSNPENMRKRHDARKGKEKCNTTEREQL